MSTVQPSRCQGIILTRIRSAWLSALFHILIQFHTATFCIILTSSFVVAEPDVDLYVEGVKCQYSTFSVIKKISILYKHTLSELFKTYVYIIQHECTAISECPYHLLPVSLTAPLVHFDLQPAAVLPQPVVVVDIGQCLYSTE